MTRHRILPAAAASIAGAIAATALLIPSHALAAGSFVGPFNKVRTVASTIPANGDVNPYGTAVVPRTVGNLHRGHVLVSNFNDSDNLQGTGTTIEDVAADGTRTQFAQIPSASMPGGIGLTTALSVLQSGWVIVGSLPTTDGTAATATAGGLIVLDSTGHVRETLTGDDINGPWDMTALDLGSLAELFVTNVLNGTVAAGGKVAKQGTVVRIDLTVSGDSPPVELSRTVIASGFKEKTDPAALVIGPTGVGLAQDGTLYVADTLGNGIRAVHNAVSRTTSAGTGATVSTGGALNGPLGLAIAPGGDILTVNAQDGNLVETTPAGMQVAVKTLDTTGSPAGSGTLFGLAVRPDDQGVYFVDDGSNTLDLLH